MENSLATYLYFYSFSFLKWTTSNSHQSSAPINDMFWSPSKPQYMTDALKSASNCWKKKMLQWSLEKIVTKFFRKKDTVQQIKDLHHEHKYFYTWTNAVTAQRKFVLPFLHSNESVTPETISAVPGYIK